MSSLLYNEITPCSLNPLELTPVESTGINPISSQYTRALPVVVTAAIGPVVCPPTMEVTLIVRSLDGASPASADPGILIKLPTAYPDPAVATDTI